jgi:prepilin peptidase CpaA
MSLLVAAFFLPFAALVIVAALRDVTTMTIPNWISLALLGAFVPAALIVQLPLATVGMCLAAFAACLAGGVAMFALRWIGGGDAKLFAACALWLGWGALTPFIAYTGIAGGVLTLTLLAGRRACEVYAVRGPGWIGRLMTQGGDVPYGVAIAAGALAAFPQSALMQAAGRLVAP